MLSTLFTLASATVLVSVANAATLRHSSHHLSSREVLASRALDGYAYDGCYTEATGQRALSGNSYYDDLMTVEKCALACSSYSTFGVEYSRECFCGNSLNEGSVIAPETDCSFNCPGNSVEKCGAGNRLNVYTKKSSGEVPTTPAPKTHTSKGCYSDPEGTRALAGKQVYGDKMNVEVCAASCAGCAYFGLEYYHECYCGNFIAATSSVLANDKCNYPCDGDANQKCGGDWALNVYSFDAASTSTVSSQRPSSTAASAFVADGCYTDSPANRVLKGAVYSDDSMTIAKCSSICSSFEMFGVEYGRECYCGNSLDLASIKAPITECSFPCSGDHTALCGAGDRLNLYRKSTLSITSTSTITTTTTTTATATTTTTTTTSQPPPAPTNKISNPSFEILSDNSWSNPEDFYNPYGAFNFHHPNSGRNSEYAATVTFTRGGQPSFVHSLTVIPGKTYTLSLWSRIKVLNPLCYSAPYILDATTTQRLAIFPTSSLSTSWTQSGGMTWTADARTEIRIAVRVYCDSVPANGNSVIYYDDFEMIES